MIDSENISCCTLNVSNNVEVNDELLQAGNPTEMDYLKCIIKDRNQLITLLYDKIHLLEEKISMIGYSHTIKEKLTGEKQKQIDKQEKWMDKKNHLII